jgi:hypothetical protein
MPVPGARIVQLLRDEATRAKFVEEGKARAIDFQLGNRHG